MERSIKSPFFWFLYGASIGVLSGEYYSHLKRLNEEEHQDAIKRMQEEDRLQQEAYVAYMSSTKQDAL